MNLKMCTSGLCVLLLALFTIPTIEAQDYEATDVRCTFAVNNLDSTQDMIVAKLRKPEGFKGHPLFADDRSIDPDKDPACQIRPDPNDLSGLKYNLKIVDFGRCGVLKRKSFVRVRIWFPQFPGVVMHSDQELIIVCKPPEPTVIENKAAGFAGSFPHNARVTGLVEETPGRLEYEVALYKEAPTAKINSTMNNELPVNQAVPIGTKLQLRARINPDSVWKYVKLMEVTVSPDSEDPHMPGSVALIQNGCRNRDFAAIIPHQPARYKERHNEVFLDFEAFLLSTMKESSTLWIHSQIKACMVSVDCQPDFCLDLYEPSALGRRRKRRDTADIREIANDERTTNRSQLKAYRREDTTNFSKFEGNLEYKVIMPEEFFQKNASIDNGCNTLLAIATTVGFSLFFTAVMCVMACSLQRIILIFKGSNKSLDDMVRQSAPYADRCYTGRPMTQ